MTKSDVNVVEGYDAQSCLSSLSLGGKTALMTRRVISRFLKKERLMTRRVITRYHHFKALRALRGINAAHRYCSFNTEERHQRRASLLLLTLLREAITSRIVTALNLQRTAITTRIVTALNPQRRRYNDAHRYCSYPRERDITTRIVTVLNPERAA